MVEIKSKDIKDVNLEDYEENDINQKIEALDEAIETHYGAIKVLQQDNWEDMYQKHQKFI